MPTRRKDMLAMFIFVGAGGRWAEPRVEDMTGTGDLVIGHAAQGAR